MRTSTVPRGEEGIQEVYRQDVRSDCLRRPGPAKSRCRPIGISRGPSTNNQNINRIAQAALPESIQVYEASGVQVVLVLLPFGQIVFLKTALSSRERPTLARNRLASVKFALLRIAQVKSA